MEPKWLGYARQLQAIAQAGLTYSKDKFDIERFEQIRAVSIDILNHYTEIEHEKIKDLFAHETGYPTPKIDVRAAIFQDDKILLVKEKSDGGWTMPGGFADVDTSLAEAVVKEVKEEAGLDVDPKRIIAVLDYRKRPAKPLSFSVYKIFVECESIRGQFQPNTETTASHFFAIDDLPGLSIQRNTPEEIKMCFEAMRSTVHEAVFD